MAGFTRSESCVYAERCKKQFNMEFSQFNTDNLICDYPRVAVFRIFDMVDIDGQSELQQLRVDLKKSLEEKRHLVVSENRIPHVLWDNIINE